MIRVMFHDQQAGIEVPVWLSDEEYEELRRSFGAKDGEALDVTDRDLSLYLEPLEIARAKSQPPVAG